MTPGIPLRVSGLTKSYGSRPVLRSLDFEARPGEFIAIIGRSGCGKSTLLRVLAGLERPDAGRVALDAPVGADAHADVRMIFQDARLLPWATVVANVSMGARGELKKRGAKATLERRALELLELVGLADRANDWPGRLSGGQRQRVSLARGLMSEPRLLLLDEPLGALDALTRIEMQRLIESLWLACGFTAVFVTHDIQEAVALAGRVIVLDDGRIVTDVELTMRRPRTRDDPQFVKTAARLLSQIFEERPHPESAPTGALGPQKPELLHLGLPGPETRTC